jgi:hypothetical protein
LGEEGYRLHRELLAGCIGLGMDLNEFVHAMLHPQFALQEKAKMRSTNGDDAKQRNVVVAATNTNIATTPIPSTAQQATQDALVKSQTTNSERETLAAPPARGMAAMAAQDSLKDSQARCFRHETTIAPATGGLASTSAQAAMKNSHVKSTVIAPPVVGIAAMAAEAALKKSLAKSSDNETSIACPIGGTGIAAMAAQAALKKSLAKSSEKETSVAPPIGESGIAAMAAQAALKKSLAKVSEKETAITPPIGGTGIAAMAAQAALKKSLAKGSEKETSVTPPIGGTGIAALAAQAAVKKSQNKSSVSEITDACTTGGIAAMAAQAALKKAQNKISDSETSIAHPSCGIASMAAHAALKKSQAKGSETENAIGPLADGVKSMPSPAALKVSQMSSSESDTLLAGGIATMAAQAALKKSLAEGPMNETVIVSPAGGIETMAAKAALKNAQGTNSVSETSCAPPTVVVAAMAPQAALTKSQAMGSESESLVASPSALKNSQAINYEIETSRAGGIAAMAAQAAMKKALARDATNETEIVHPAGGIAAMAAQAALKKARGKCADSETSIVPTIAIAAMAAQAALKKSQSKVSDSETFIVPAGGGIAAIAAQVALKKSRASSAVSETSIALSAGGIAAMAAQAAVKKAQNESAENDISMFLSGGESAEMPAHTAAAASQAETIALVAEATQLQAPRNGDHAESPKHERNDADVNSRSLFFSDASFMSAIFEAGISEAISNPRDLPCFCCLYMISTRIHALGLADSKMSKDSTLSDEMTGFMRKLLLRSLSISNQATSIGMVGWLEYGTSNQLERSLRLPFELLQQLACNMATNDNWAGATGVLSSLVIRCQEDLPKCHPTTLSAMLDFAGATLKTKGANVASFVTNEVSDLLSSFLTELERLFFDQHLFKGKCDQNFEDRIYFDDRIDALTIMDAFTVNFRNELSRDFLRLLGPDHHILLLNHSLVAHSCVVLANCLSFAQHDVDGGDATLSMEERVDPCTGRYFWWLAYSHYEIAFQGWVKVLSLSNPFTASAACSLARCLREVGHINQAISILETLASCLEKTIDIAKRDESKVPDETEEQTINIPQEQIRVHCLWMLAVMTTQKSPDERGRQRSLSLLHTASLALQRTLNRGHLDDDTRKICHVLYDTVEDEALALFEPLKHLSIPEARHGMEDASADESMRQTNAYWEAATPMRERRKEWISPRTRRYATAAAELKQKPQAFVLLV